MSDPIYDLLDEPFPGRPGIPLNNEKYVENARYGLGNYHVENGAIYWFNSWLNLQKGDYFGIRITDPDSPAAKGIVEDFQTHYALKVPAELMVEGEFNMFGRVVSLASQNESRSEPVLILVLRNTPGGSDKEPWKKYHSNFVMKLRDLDPHTIIDAAIATVGFFITIERYPFIRKNDRIRTFYDGILIEHIVSPEQADGSEPIDIHISPEVIKKGNQLGKIGLAFTVKNVLGEGPNDEHIYSDRIWVDADLRPGLLPTPFLYVNEEETRQLNLSENKLSTIVLEVAPGRKVPAPAPAKRNKIVVVAKSTNAQGIEIETIRLAPVIDLNRGHESISIDYSLFATVPSGFIHLWFEWCDTNGVVIGVSGTIIIFVSGLPVILPAVTVDPEEAGLVSSAIDLNVRMALYAPHAPEFLETLEAQQTKPGGGLEVFTQLQLAGPPLGKRVIPKSVLAKFALNGPVTLFYTVNNGKGDASSVLKSEPLMIEVDGRKEELDAPYLVGAENGNFDPSKQDSDEVAVKIIYPFTVKGDRVVISLVGQKPGGSFSRTIDISAAIEGQTFPMLEHMIPAAILLKNIDSTFSLGYSVISGDTILRSKLLEVSVGPDVELLPVHVPEAGEIQTTLEPTAATHGATVKIRVKPMRLTDIFYIFWRGMHGVSTYEVAVAGNPHTNEASAIVPAHIIARALRPEGNRIQVGFYFILGSTHYKSQILEIDLQPYMTTSSASIDGLINGSMLEISSLTAKSAIEVKPWPLIQKNQKVTLRMTFTGSDGTESVLDILIAEPVTDNQVTNGIVLPLPLAELKTAKEGTNISLQLLVNFTESSALSTAIDFPTTHYTAKTLPSTLPHPTLVNGSGIGASVTAEALSLVSSVLVNVVFQGMLKSDVVTATYFHQNGTSASLTLNGVISGPLQFNFASLGVQHFSPNTTIKLRYTVQRGTKIINSAEQTVRVNPIPQANLPKPTINNLANGGQLDRNSYGADGTLRVAAWPLAKQGQRIWVKLVGTGGTRYVLNRVITAAEAVNGLTVQISRGELLAHAINNWMTVQGTITFDGNPNEASGTPLAAVQYLNTDSFSYILQYFINNTSPWAIGNAGAGVKFQGTGIIQFSNPNVQNAGTLLSTTLNLNTAHTYRIVYPVWNIGGPTRPPPIIAIGAGSKVILNPYVVPVSATWLTLTYDFKPSTNGPQQITISNYQSAKDSLLYNCWVNIYRVT